MKESEKQKIKDTLRKEIARTKQKIIKYSELCKPIAPENAIGRVSRMDAINNKSVVEAALREAQKKMKQLLAMKDKVNNTKFGNCIKCNQTIPLMRLLIKPHARFCVHCAQ